jgi:hypothetical protein
MFNLTPLRDEAPKVDPSNQMNKHLSLPIGVRTQVCAELSWPDVTVGRTNDVIQSRSNPQSGQPHLGHCILGCGFVTGA